MINRVVLTGRVTSDPELRQTQDGTSVLNFDIAVERSFRKKNGEKAVDFFSIIAWNKLAEVCSMYFHKGMMVAVDGKLQNRSYEKDGVIKKYNEVIAEEVQFLSAPRKNDDYLGSDDEIPN